METHTVQMPLYTRTGDKGSTSLAGGARVSKNSSTIRALGALDLLSAHLGKVESEFSALNVSLHGWEHVLENILHALLDLGAHVASRGRTDFAYNITTLEHWIDSLEAVTPPLKKFILCTGHPVACDLHIARSVCRQAEVELVELAESDEEGYKAHEVLPFINRLSDACFALARWVNHVMQMEEVTHN